MKVTKDGVEYSIKTPRYHYSEYVGGVLFPKSIQFVGTFKGLSEIQNLRFVDWVGMLIHNKIVVPSEDVLKPEVEQGLRSASPLADPFLIVEDTDQGYITKMLFTIANTLLEKDSQLIALRCKE